MPQIRKAGDIAGTTNPSTYLTNYSFRLQQDDSNFVAGVAASRIPVELESAKYNVYPPGYFWRDEAKVRPLGGRPAQVGYAVEDGTYSAEEWALEHVIDDRQRRNVRAQINLDENATKLLTGKQMIRADRIWAQKFFVPAAWGQQVAGVASAPGANQFLTWNDAASIPLQNVEDWKEIIRLATGMEPNVLILGSNVAKALKNHPEFVDRIKYTSSASITLQVMASLFGVDQVRVARSLYNTANERMPNDNHGGKSLQYIADPNAALLAYIDPNPTIDSPTAIANFAWTGLIPGMGNDFGGVISRGRDERAYSDWFHNRQAFDLRKVSDDLAVFITAATTK